MRGSSGVLAGVTPLLALLLCACGSDSTDAGGAGAGSSQSQYWYFVFDMDFLASQLQTYADIAIDPDAAAWKGLFTDADRSAELNDRPGCPVCTSEAPICALTPSPACVQESQKQGSLDEYADFLPIAEPPAGFSFAASGSIQYVQDGMSPLESQPFPIQVPGTVAVELTGVRMTGSLQQQGGRWRATGTFYVSNVSLNGSGSGPSGGSFQAMSLSKGEVASVESFGHKIPLLP